MLSLLADTFFCSIILLVDTLQLCTLVTVNVVEYICWQDTTLLAVGVMTSSLLIKRAYSRGVRVSDRQLSFLHI